jgi:hypothetical protein
VPSRGRRGSGALGLSSGAPSSGAAASSSSSSASAAAAAAPTPTPAALNAPYRARAALASGPSHLLLSGVTVVLWGEFERPPKNVTRAEVTELVALAGGKAVEVADLAAVPAGSAGSAGASESTVAGGLRRADSAASGASSWSGGLGAASEIASGAAGGGGGSGFLGRSHQSLEDDAAIWKAATKAAVAAVPTSAASAVAAARGGSGGGVGSASGLRRPALVILCDEPHFPIPACAAALAAAHPGSVAMVGPEWLLDSASCYSALPLAKYAHPGWRV